MWTALLTSNKGAAIPTAEAPETKGEGGGAGRGKLKIVYSCTRRVILDPFLSRGGTQRRADGRINDHVSWIAPNASCPGGSAPCPTLAPTLGTVWRNISRRLGYTLLRVRKPANWGTKTTSPPDSWPRVPEFASTKSTQIACCRSCCPAAADSQKTLNPERFTSETPLEWPEGLLPRWA